MGDSLRRLRALVNERFDVIVVILAVLVCLGGAATYTAHVDPGTTTEQRPVSSWETAGWFNHSATVTESNSLYPVGTTLIDRSVYFASIAPWLNGTYSFTYDASEGGDLNGTVSLQFVLRSVEETRESETVVWRITEPLGTASNESLEPGETIRVPFSVNVNETMNRTQEIEEELNHPPGSSELLIRATVDIQGTVNGRDVDHVMDHALPVKVQQGTYRPANPSVMTDRQESTRTVTVQRTYGPLKTVGGPLLLLGSAVALVGLVTARKRENIALSQNERELLAYHDDCADFDDWISPIHLPEEAFDLPRAEAASLGALVDFAIDTDNAVIEDPGGDAYYVVYNGYLYTYRPPACHNGETTPRTEIDKPEPGDDASPAAPTTDGGSTTTATTNDEPPASSTTDSGSEPSDGAEDNN